MIPNGGIFIPRCSPSALYRAARSLALSVLLASTPMLLQQPAMAQSSEAAATQATDASADTTV